MNLATSSCYKGDYYLNSKNSFTGTYNYINNPTDRPDQGAFYTTVPPVSNTIKDNLLSLSWRWTALRTLTNELRGGYMRSDTSFLDSNEYPTSILSATDLLFSNPVNTFLNQGRKVNTYYIQDNANWLKGKHELSFGFQSQMLRVAPVQRRRHRPDLYSGHQRGEHPGSDGHRSAGHPLRRSHHRQQSVREPGRDRQQRRPDIQRHQHDLRLRARAPPTCAIALTIPTPDMCRTSGRCCRTSPSIWVCGTSTGRRSTRRTACTWRPAGE